MLEGGRSFKKQSVSRRPEAPDLGSGRWPFHGGAGYLPPRGPPVEVEPGHLARASTRLCAGRPTSEVPPSRVTPGYLRSG
jgi:hypothetical protein